MLPAAARGLYNSAVYFGSEITALASNFDLKRIQIITNHLGRLTLRKHRTEHISNYDVYNTIGIHPIKVISCIQTLLFWRKQYDIPQHSILKNALLKSFATSRHTNFISINSAKQPTKNLIKFYLFYVAHCRSTNTPHYKFTDKYFAVCQYTTE